LGGSASNYVLSDDSASGEVGTIIPTNINVTATTNLKMYDATTSAEAQPIITFGHLQADDSWSSYGEVYSSKNVGVNKTLIPYASIDDGNGGNNYYLTLVGNIMGVITNRPVAVTNFIVLNKIYDGTTNANFVSSNAILIGILVGDHVVLNTNGVVAYFADANVGTNKPVTVIGLSLGNSDAANYVLIAPTNFTANISPLVPPTMLTSAISVGPGNLQFSFTGQIGQNYKVMASSDLREPLSNWINLSSGSFTSSTSTFTDTVTEFPVRFYIIKSP